MADSVRIETRGAIDRLLASLTGYEDRVRASLRPAAQSGAQILYDEMRRRAPVGSKPARIRGKTYPPGLLRDSIYQVFSESNSDPTKATYHVGPNKKKAGHWAWVEFGHYATRQRRFSKTFRGPVKAKWVPAQPYIRPTWDGFGTIAVARMREVMRVRLAERRGK